MRLSVSLKRSLLVGSLLVLTGCASSMVMPKKVEVERPTKSTFIEAIKQPIYSVNLMREEIPDSLKNITKSYQPPLDCEAYRHELTLLDRALGEDTIDRESLSSDTVTLHLGKMITDNVESTIPFNSIIKSLSGAKKHERRLLSAKIKGNARRSYLKGWAAAEGCALYQADA